MSDTTQAVARQKRQADPYRYGWRYVLSKDAKGLDPWIQVPLTREDILQRVGSGPAGKSTDNQIAAAIRDLAAKMPTYITLKEVKKRWGHGQEDVFPVAQFEKLWGDMTALPEIATSYAVVPRARGQQLKDPAQLDGWLRDGSAAYLESLCEWH